MDSSFAVTPDGRYFVVRGRLWRMSRPDLSETDRARLVQDLSAARRAIRSGKRMNDRMALKAARQNVDTAKRALGERGPPWWTDGAPDFNRKMVSNTPYSDWYADWLSRQPSG